MQHKVHWTVSLSNGETLYEEKSNFQTIEGALSPWQRLLSYIAENRVTITSLSLYTDDGKRWNIPSAGKSPKFHAIATAPKPVDYTFFRKVAANIDPNTGKTSAEEKYACIEALYESGTKMQVWVNDETYVSWSLVLYG